MKGFVSAGEPEPGTMNRNAPDSRCVRIDAEAAKGAD